MQLNSGDSAPSRTPLVGFVVACSFVVVVAILDLLEGSGTELAGLLIAAPFIAAAYATYWHVAVVGVFAAVVAGGLGIASEEAGTTGQIIRISAIAAGTVGAAGLSVVRTRRGTELATLAHLAAVAQQAVLRPVDAHVGDLSVAVRYVSASVDAEIGGDLYEALDTPYGVRMLIGDVRGKGLEAVRLASVVLGSYRHVAYERADLRAIVTDLDRAVARSVESEDFVTACLVEERGGTLTVLNCGHPAPLLLRRGRVISLEPPTVTPPLGFMPTVHPRVERLEPGDRILLFTDGLTEARRAGEFFPLRERAWRILGHGAVEDGLLSLENALNTWVSGRLDDDIALVLVEYTGARSSAADRPTWEWGVTPVATPRS